MMNRIIAIGRLTKDVEMRVTQSGISVATFTIAVDRGFTTANGEKETDFIPVVVWRGLAENCEKYLSKGKMAAVEGRLQIRTYETDNGEKRRIAEIVADNVQFLSPKEKGESFGYAPEDYEETQPMDDIPL